MKNNAKYIYKGEKPYRVTDTYGEVFDIEKGDVIVYTVGLCKCKGNYFSMKSDMEPLFKRMFTADEIEYYNKLRDKAAIDAMHVMLGSEWWMEKITKDERESKNEFFSSILADYAMKFAIRIVDRLIEYEEEGE